MNWAVFAASADFAVSLLHIIIVFILGAKGYRTFGAGERFAKAAEAGYLFPHIVTLLIAAVFFLFGLYSLSVGQLGFALPYTQMVAIGITVIYLGRGLAGIPIYFSGYENKPLMIWSSVVSFGIGLIHLINLSIHSENLI